MIYWEDDIDVLNIHIYYWFISIHIIIIHIIDLLNIYIIKYLFIREDERWIVYISKKNVALWSVAPTVSVTAFRATEGPVNKRIKGHWSAGLYHRQVSDSLVIDCITTTPRDKFCIMSWADCKNLASVKNHATER